MLVSFSWFLFQFDVFVGAKHFLYSAFTVKKKKKCLHDELNYGRTHFCSYVSNPFNFERGGIGYCRNHINLCIDHTFDG